MPGPLVRHLERETGRNETAAEAVRCAPEWSTAAWRDVGVSVVSCATTWGVEAGRLLGGHQWARVRL